MTRLLPQAFFVAAIVVALLTLPPHIEQTFSPEPQAKPRQAETSPAPIWSRRCIERGQTMIAHQADGGPWIVHCTGKAVRL